MSFDLCVTVYYKMTLCQIRISGKLDKYQTHFPIKHSSEPNKRHQTFCLSLDQNVLSRKINFSITISQTVSMKFTTLNIIREILL